MVPFKLLNFVYMILETSECWITHNLGGL